MNYRAEIDGLRAIAVVSVILYHAQIVIFGRDWFEGGFIGVDIFFVISGYLITRIILTELEETNSFSFIKFYERRARRILPMLFLVIVVCIPFAWQKLLPLDLVDFAKSALSAIGFGSNFFFYLSTTNYGTDTSFLKPLLHTWSLGVEEQFYIFFPIFTLLIWKFARKSFLTLLIGMLLMSIQFADVMEGTNSDFNFFLPFSRFWELFIGSALALIELKYGRTKNVILTQTLPILGLFLVVHSITFFNESTPHPSFQTLMPIVGVALVIMFCSTEDFVGKVLSLKPIVGVGLISYSLYLWHFPIFAFGRIGSFNPSAYDKLEWIALAFLLSIISYYLIERPFRKKYLITTKIVYVTFFAVISGLVFFNYNLIKNDGYKSRLPQILLKQNLDEAVWDNFKQNGKPCYQRKSDFCKIENDISLTTVYSLSDSHFSAMSPQLVKFLGKQFNYTEANIGSCPFVLGVNKYNLGGKHAHCTNEFQNLRYSLINHKPSIILIGGRFPLYLNSMKFDNKEGGVEGGKTGPFKAIDGSTFEDAFKKTIDKLTKDGHQIIFVYPIPEVGVHVPKHLFQKIQKIKEIKNLEVINQLISLNPLTTSYKVYSDRTKSTFELFDSIKFTNVHRVYPHKLFCDIQIKNRCVTYNKDEVFYADDDHPSDAGAEMVVNKIMHKIFAAEENIRKIK